MSTTLTSNHALSIDESIVKDFRFDSLTGDNNLVEQLEKQDLIFRKQLDFKSPKKIVFYGNFLAFNRGTCNYLNQYLKTVNPDDVLVFNQMVELRESRILERINCDYQTLPWIIQRDRDLSLASGEVSDHMIKLIDDFQEISSVARESLRLSRPEMTASAIELFIYYCISASMHIVESLKPEIVVLWNQFSCTHSILDYVCKKFNITVRYWEFGVLPGTFGLESKGQMGESWPAVQPSEFSSLSIDESDVFSAKKTLKYLYESKLNRNVQPKDAIPDHIQSIANNGRKTVLYIGQNDFESGLLPYTAHSAKFHSPAYSSSLDALDELSLLAKKNNWNLIYKPHPIMSRYYGIPSELPENITYVDAVNMEALIDICDVVVTILSTTAYSSLIREKATMCLGYTQLKGKGCTYEAFDRVELESELKSALKYGVTAEMSEKWVVHVAQLMKYYLVDDLTDKPIKIGLGVDFFATKLDR